MTFRVPSPASTRSPGGQRKHNVEVWMREPPCDKRRRTQSVSRHWTKLLCPFDAGAREHEAKKTWRSNRASAHARGHTKPFRTSSCESTSSSSGLRRRPLAPKCDNVTNCGVVNTYRRTREGSHRSLPLPCLDVEYWMHYKVELT
jgi:hypothetical protein